MTREVTFTSKGLRLAGDLYLPDGPGPHPIVVMAGGWCYVKEIVQPTYAQMFADALIRTACTPTFLALHLARAGKPGPLLYAVAAGLMLFGMFSIIEARYRRIHEPPVDEIKQEVRERTGG